MLSGGHWLNARLAPSPDGILLCPQRSFSSRCCDFPALNAPGLRKEVLSSLEEPEEGVAAAWARELERRSRDISEGRVQPVDWETARGQILKELRHRRAMRSSC